MSVAVRDPVSRNVTPPAASKIKKYRAVEAAQPALTFGAVRRVSPGTATVSIHSNCAGEYYCVMAPEGSG
ncbi:MAG: hypothetical protein LBS62_00905, partial [Clostridiales bacterium]|nr:hypothetical protein [Clostridiales bacterium]